MKSLGVAIGDRNPMLDQLTVDDLTANSGFLLYFANGSLFERPSLFTATTGNVPFIAVVCEN